MSMIFSVPNSNPRQPWLNGMRKLSSIIIASLLVEDPPDWQQSKHKKRSGSPCSTSRRKRRVQRRSIVSTPIAPLNLEEEEDQQQISKQENEKESMKEKTGVEDEKKAKVNEPASLHCLDKLREELSCAICLEICYEPSTTPCGHSFCKKCLRSAADKCGKRCPKCRQLISNGRSCTVNTVLWNTIQLLFPKEVEARKAAGREIEESGSRSSRRTRTRTRARVALAATETRMTVGGLGVSFRFTVGVRFRSGSYSSSSLSMVDVSPSCREKVIDSYDLLSAFSHHCFHPYAQQKLQLAADFVRLDSSLLVGLPFL